MSKATVADTICALAVEEPLPAQPIDPPTITVTFGINDSPLAGRDGKKVQSRVIRDRLMKEAESNVAIRGRRHAGRRGLRGLGPGRIADGRPDREHAPRGVRAVDLAPAGVILREENGQRWSPSRKSPSTSMTTTPAP
jgi:GTP-binding protein